MFISFEESESMFSSTLILITFLTTLPPPLDSVPLLYSRCRLHAKDQRSYCRVSEANTLQMTFKHKQQCANYCEQLISQHSSYTSQVIHDYPHYYSQLLENKTKFKFNVDTSTTPHLLSLSNNYLYATFSKYPHIPLPEIMSSSQACCAFNFSPASGLCQLFLHSALTSYRFNDDSCTYYEVGFGMEENNRITE